MLYFFPRGFRIYHFEKREVIELNKWIYINGSLSTADFDYGPTPRLARGALKTW